MDEATVRPATTAVEMLEVPATEGRVLEVLVAGPPDGFPVVYHSGQPSAAVPGSPLEPWLEPLGLRMVTYSRPGYGGSTPWPEHRRPTPVAADVPDTVAVLDQLGIDTFLTLGWSGGGPRAIACAALLPDRCRAAAVLAGVAPPDAPDLDFTADMGPENVRDIEAARQGYAVLEPFVASEAAELRAVTGGQMAEALGGLVDQVDAAALTGDLAEYVAASSRASVRLGHRGFLDDAMSITRPWGLDLDTITVPVAIWQGRHDLMVPFGHGTWLASHIPGARAHLFDDEGHCSLAQRMDRILADLKELAGI